MSHNPNEPNRQPKGTPAGGQFAPNPRATGAAPVELDHWQAAELRLSQLAEHVAQVFGITDTAGSHSREPDMYGLAAGAIAMKNEHMGVSVQHTMDDDFSPRWTKVACRWTEPGIELGLPKEFGAVQARSSYRSPEGLVERTYQAALVARDVNERFNIPQLEGRTPEECSLIRVVGADYPYIEFEVASEPGETIRFTINYPSFRGHIESMRKTDATGETSEIGPMDKMSVMEVLGEEVSRKVTGATVPEAGWWLLDGLANIWRQHGALTE